MKSVLTQRGETLYGRAYQRYTGDVEPGQKPIPPWEVEEYRRLKDGAPPQPVEGWKLVAPGNTLDAGQPWQGRVKRKPWQYSCWVAIPNLATTVQALEPLRLAVALWRRQTVRPYLLVVDTGSVPDCLDRLFRLEADDLEILQVRAHGYRHSSEPVSVAMDCAFARCCVDRMFATHSDVFPVRRDLLGWYTSRCGPTNPVVGYQMSPRAGTDLWRICPSHTATMFHLPTMRQHGISWNIPHAYARLGLDLSNVQTVGWPDTETNIGLGLQAAGITPEFIGPEKNFALHRDQNIVHCRSYQGSAVYGGKHSKHHKKARRWVVEESRAALARLHEWGGELPLW